MSRRNQYAISVSIDGTPLGIFDAMPGGAYDSEEQKYKPGAMAPEVSLGGSKTTTNFTVTRLFRLERDLALVPFLKAKVGNGRVVASKQSLDVNKNPYGTPDVYTGTLKTFTPVEPDSTSNDPALFSLEVSADGG
jgi:hypothetical protein